MVNGNINITINKVTAFKLIGMQLIVTILVSAFFFVYVSYESAYSALIGGIIFIVPNAYFVQCALRGKGHHPPEIILRWFYMGEAGKLILTGVLFAACFALVNNLFIPALFGTYILMLIINMVSLARIKN